MFSQNIRRIRLTQKENYNEQKQNSKSPFISLVEKNFDFFPKLFTITTNNRSYKFNVDILKDMSKTISNQLRANPNNLKYHLDINDERKVMQKFEDIFNGLYSTFELVDFSTIWDIIKLLDIINCPIYFNPNANRNLYTIPSQIDLEINRISLIKFLSSDAQKTFTIKTNKKEYKCSKIGIFSSKVIRDLKTAHPEINEYKYNFEDDNDEFNDICKLFNFERIQITTNNMNSLKQISEELQIEPIIDSINEFVSSYENSIQLIDDKKVIIETIDEIFDLLHHIQNLTVESVKKSIVHSIWVKTEENVQELAACILQAVRIGYKLQPYLIDLIVSLNESANDRNKLCIFLPYLVNFLRSCFSKSMLYCSFYLKMGQKGIVDMDEVLKDAHKVVFYKHKETHEREYYNNDVTNVLKWFLPELFEQTKNNEDFYSIRIDRESANFLKKYFPSHIEEYRKLRDSGMPFDDISKAIYIDDVDTLQSIVSKHGIDINKAKIPSSIFDVFKLAPTQQMSLLNYSAMNGSTKCFKYLLLNHAEMDDLSFVLSIYGGNTEIIRLVDQNAPLIFHNEMQNFSDNDIYYSFNNNTNSLYYYIYSEFDDVHYTSEYYSNILAPAIMNHQNDLFDWIFENKSEEIEKISILDIAFIAVQNGNAHALIQCIDKGLDIHSNYNSFLVSIIIEACHRGFFRILQLIISLCGNNFSLNINQIDQIFYTGNLSIYKLLKDKLSFTQNINQYTMNCQYIILSIKQNYNKLLLEFFAENSILSFNDLSIKTIFKTIIECKNTFLFNFLKGQFTLDKIDDICSSFYLLNKCCKYGFFEAVKELTEYILSKYPSANFTSSFYQALCGKHPEIYKYFIDKDVKITIKQSDRKLYSITQIENDLFTKVLDKIDPFTKEDVLNEIFDLAVINGNQNLVEILIDESRLNYLSLINAVKSSNLKIVDIILNNKNDHAFINTVNKDGTALNIAVRNNDIEIVKRLLSVPKINTVLYDNKNCTPLMTAISNFNIEIIDLFVQYYGEQLETQIWQMNKSIENILRLLSNEDEKLNQQKKQLDADDNSYNEYEENHINDERIINTKSMFISKKEKMLKTMSKLSEFENVDFNCYFSSYSLLSYACEVNDFDLFNFLLKSNKVNINSYSPLTGNTPLMVAILSSNTQIAQILIENNQTDINHRNYSDQTALTIAASKENEAVFNSLIHNEKFDCELSAINNAYFKSSSKINKLLLKEKVFDININMKTRKYIDLLIGNNDCNADGNQRYNDYYYIKSNNFSTYFRIPFITPLIKAVFDLQDEIINEIVSHPSFNKEKSHFIDAIFASVYMNDINIFRKLISLFGNDVNLVGFEGNSLLCFSVYMMTADITTEILNHNSFDSVKSDIVSAFLKAGCFITKESNMNGEEPAIKISKNLILTKFGTPRFGLLNNLNNGAAIGGFNVQDPNAASINQMDNLFNYDENHNNLIKLNETLPSGKTYFTSIDASILNAESVANFLITRGVDPNIPDSNGVYPLEYALQTFNTNLISTIIHTENINLSIISTGNSLIASKGYTVLHMLLSTTVPYLFKEVLDMQDLDIINKEDENGDTPLLSACKACKLNYIMLLFSEDNLDYKHRNKEGYDALDCLKGAQNQFIKGQYQQLKNSFGWGGGINSQNDFLVPDDIKSEEKRDYYKKILDYF